MNKQKVFHTTGITNPLIDGIKRHFTLVAIVSTEVIEDTIETNNMYTTGTKRVYTSTFEKVTAEKQTLSIGLAVISPADVATATSEQGIAIAKGKAEKVKSAQVVLTNYQGYFTNTFVKNILEVEATKVTKNPGRYVHLSSKVLNTDEDKKIFSDAIANTPAPSPAFKAARKNYHEVAVDMSTRNDLANK